MVPDARAPHHATTRVARTLMPEPYATSPPPTVPRRSDAVATTCVGLTEQEAQARGRPYLKSVRPYADAAYGWALEDTTGFVKPIADPSTRQLLGVHVLGPQAPLLAQPLLQAMMLGQTVDQIGHDVPYIHPALTEVVEQALLDL